MITSQQPAPPPPHLPQVMYSDVYIYFIDLSIMFPLFSETSSSHDFSTALLFLKRNSLDFKFYLSKLTDEKIPIWSYDVM